MASVTIGSGILDFGLATNMNTEAFFMVGGQGSILAASEVEAWVMEAYTVDHSNDEHRIENLYVFPGNVTIGSGFIIYGESRIGSISGKYLVQWAWV